MMWEKYDLMLRKCRTLKLLSLATEILLCGENLGMLQAALLTLQFLLDRMVSACVLMPYV